MNAKSGSSELPFVDASQQKIDRRGQTEAALSRGSSCTGTFSVLGNQAIAAAERLREAIQTMATAVDQPARQAQIADD